MHYLVFKQGPARDLQLLGSATADSPVLAALEVAKREHLPEHELLVVPETQFLRVQVEHNITHQVESVGPLTHGELG